MQDDVLDNLLARFDGLALSDSLLEQLAIDLEEKAEEKEEEEGGGGGRIRGVEMAPQPQSGEAGDVKLPPMVEYRLACLIGRHCQKVDHGARLQLAMAGEEVALLAIDRLEKAKRPGNLSAYLVWFLKRHTGPASSNPPATSPKDKKVTVVPAFPPSAWIGQPAITSPNEAAPTFPLSTLIGQPAAMSPNKVVPTLPPSTRIGWPIATSPSKAVPTCPPSTPIGRPITTSPNKAAPTFPSSTHVGQLAATSPSMAAPTLPPSTHIGRPTAMPPNKAVPTFPPSTRIGQPVAKSPNKGKATVGPTSPPSTRIGQPLAMSPPKKAKASTVPTSPLTRIGRTAIATPSASSASARQTRISSFFGSLHCPQPCHEKRIHSLLSSLMDSFDDSFLKDLESEEEKHSLTSCVAGGSGGGSNGNRAYWTDPTTRKSHKRKLSLFCDFLRKSGCPWSLAMPSHDWDMADVGAVARRLDLRLEEQFPLSDNMDVRPLQDDRPNGNATASSFPHCGPTNSPLQDWDVTHVGVESRRLDLHLEAQCPLPHVGPFHERGSIAPAGPLEDARLDGNAGIRTSRHCGRSTHWTKLKDGKCIPSPIPIEHPEALGELCQVRSLLVLSSFPEGGWEEVVSPQTIRGFKEMPFEEIDNMLQHVHAHHKNLYVNPVRKDWARMQQGYHVVFYCDVNRNGWCTFKGPQFELSGSPLQRVFGDGGVLRVHFADLEGNLEAEGQYRKKAREGIWAGLRHYELYAFKDPKVKKKGGIMQDISTAPRCFFICTNSSAKADLDNPSFRQFDSVAQARDYMMNIASVSTESKKFSRLQLALSLTVPVLDLSDPKINVEVIDDIFCTDEKGAVVYDENGEPLIHTDGTGFVSKDIASLCPTNVFKGKKKDTVDDQVEGMTRMRGIANLFHILIKKSHGRCLFINQCWRYNEDKALCHILEFILLDEYPLLMQVRVFYKGSVSKGILLVNLKLPPFTIQIRQSMLKVKQYADISKLSFNSLELCTTSRRPGQAKLFQHLALLLINGGVPEELLLEYAQQALNDIRTIIRDRRSAIAALSGKMDQGIFDDLILRMLLSGIPLSDAYLQKSMWDICKSQLIELSKCRIPIRDTHNLIGCADPTGKLERNQVAILLDRPVHGIKVIVYKPPGLHDGDPHVFEAIWYKEFEEYIGTAKYAIFFSVKGPRAVVDEIANSDLDGDQYWVCLNSKLVKSYKPFDAWQKPFKTKKPMPSWNPNQEEFENRLFEKFLSACFHPSYAMGVATNNWLAHMDRYLSPEGMVEAERFHIRQALDNLVNTYYDAVDAEKSGEQVAVRDIDKATALPHFMEKEQEITWIVQKRYYHSKTILGKVFDMVRGECDSDDFSWEPTEIIIEEKFNYPGIADYCHVWKNNFMMYRLELKDALHKPECDDRSAKIEAILQKYRREFYGADTKLESQLPIEELYKRASAIYIIVYTSAQKKLEEALIKLERRSYGLQFVWKIAGIVLCQLYCQRLNEEPLVVSSSILKELKLSKRDALKTIA